MSGERRDPERWYDDDAVRQAARALFRSQMLFDNGFFEQAFDEERARYEADARAMLDAVEPSVAKLRLEAWTAGTQTSPGEAERALSPLAATEDDEDIEDEEIIGFWTYIDAIHRTRAATRWRTRCARSTPTPAARRRRSATPSVACASFPRRLRRR